MSGDTVVYTGTHDNATTRGWFEALPEDQRRNVWNYLKRPGGNSDEVAWELIRLAWSRRICRGRFRFVPRPLGRQQQFAPNPSTH
jgi:4-alpha-glucanotransferase